MKRRRLYLRLKLLRLLEIEAEIIIEPGSQPAAI
jgi:hypothetical protein